MLDVEDIGLVSVTKASHPALFEALDIIAGEVGLGGYDNYSLDGKWDRKLGEFDRKLKGLTPVELRAFCLGDERKGLAMAQGLGLLEIADLLNEFCDNDS